MVARLTTILFFFVATISSAQTYTFECVSGARLSGDSCDICPNTIVESRSFNGLVIYRDSAFWRWVDQPYSIRVKPGGLVEYWEHSVNPYSERITIPFDLTGFFSIEGMADSTWCNSSAPNRFQGLTIDSLNATQAVISLSGDPTDEFLEEGQNILFSYEGDTLTISVDTTGLGGGGVGLDTLVAIPPAAGFTITGSPAQNSRDTLTFTLANDLAALEALSDTGIVVRTAAETYALRKIAAGAGISVSNSGGVSGNPTITNTDPDQSTTNEAWTIDADDADTEVISTQTVKFQGSGGITTNYVPGTDILEINNTAGTNYQTWRDDGVAATQRPNANFVSTATVTMTLTDDAGNTETEVTANVPTDGITATQIAAGAVGTSEIATGGVATVDIADQAVTYVKIQNSVANNVLLGNNNGANTSFEELDAAAVQTMLGYIDGTGLAAQRIAYGSDANTIKGEAAFLYNETNDRMTVVCTTPALGVGAAVINVQNLDNDPSGEAFRADGNITGNWLMGILNSATGAATNNTIMYVSQAGNSAGDAAYQAIISGASGNRGAWGIDNSDANKMKFSPNANLPGENANASLVATMDAAPLWGMNIDAPGRTLDVGGGARAINLINTAANPSSSNLGAGLGTGGVVNSVTGGNNGFRVVFTTGTGPGADGDLFRITLANGFTTTASWVWQAASVTALNESAKFLMNGTSPGFVNMKANGTLTASTQYILNFVVVGQ